MERLDGYGVQNAPFSLLCMYQSVTLEGQEKKRERLTGFRVPDAITIMRTVRTGAAFEKITATAIGQ